MKASWVALILIVERDDVPFQLTAYHHTVTEKLVFPMGSRIFEARLSRQVIQARRDEVKRVFSVIRISSDA